MNFPKGFPTELPKFSFPGEENAVKNCTQCRVEFDYKTFRHNCRKCGLTFCFDCTQNKLIIPQEEIAPRQESGWNPADLLASDEDYRKPMKVCFACFYLLKDKQADLRMSVSRAHQEDTAPQKSAMPSLPSAIDFYLEKEIRKATAMVTNFKHTLDGEGIPRELLRMAKGVVFFTIVKLGFVFTGRYGTGLIVARLADGTWSAPSAVQMSGVGWGLQVGAELTNVMLILRTENAVKAFKSHAQVSVGAELGVSMGPVGRSLETDVTAGGEGAAHAFSYAQSKGLFVGASLEASGIAARPDVNRAYYGENLSVAVLLQGDYPPPKGAQMLYQALDALSSDEGKPSSSGAASSGEPGDVDADSTWEDVDPPQTLFSSGASAGKPKQW